MVMPLQASAEGEASAVTAAAPEVAAEATSPQKDSAAESEVTSGADGADAEAAEEEQWLEIWRPGGRGERRGNNNRSGGPRQKSGFKDAKGKSGKRGGPRQEGGQRDGERPRNNDKRRGKPRDQAPRKPEKVADPDSPFAALAALKANLDKGK